MITSSKKPEEVTKMMRRLMSKLFGKKKATVEREMTTQATKITKVLAQLDTLSGKVGN